MPTSVSSIPPDEAPRDSVSEDKRRRGLRVYASIAAACALLVSCFALFNGIYSIVGLIWPWLGLGVPEALLRNLISSCIALPIASGVLIFHYRLLVKQSH